MLRGKGDGFTPPPAAYFEQLADRLAEEGLPSRMKPAAVHRLSPRYARAAAILLILAVGIWLLLRPAAPVTEQPSLRAETISIDDLSEAEIMAYIDANIDEFDTEFIYESDEENLDQTN